MDDLVQRARKVADFLQVDEMSSVMSSDTVSELCDRIEALERELAEERSLCDRLYKAYNAVNDALGCQHSVSLAAYRKARGEG